MSKRKSEEHDNFYHYDDRDYECKKPNCNVTKFRNPDGTLRLRNPHIKKLRDGDFLYHLALGTKSHNLEEMFGDVKFVCMGGTAKRMETLANYIMKEIGYKLPTGSTLQDLTSSSLRFAMYKVGPVLCVSHGMGIPSISILLHEIIKLVHHAKAKDPIFFRVGTCGGIGLKGGDVIVSDSVIDELGNPYYQQPVCGKLVKKPAILDKKLAQELKSLSELDDGFEVVNGTTMAANCFYEGQGRTDGAFCEYTEEDKMEYLKMLHEKGVRNIEMEGTVFAAHTYHAGIKSAVVNVALLNRLEGDQVTTPKEVMMEWQNHPQIIVTRYIKRHLQNSSTNGI
jgi:uridine phosphorylase